MDSKLLIFILHLSVPQLNGYVYDQKYPIVLTTNEILPETKEGVTLTTDHFFSIGTFKIFYLSYTQ